MVSFLQIENLSKSYGDRFLFSDVTFGIYEGDKIGIIAANGTGKSTFLNIISGAEDYDDGRIVWRNNIRIGYLPQLPPYEPSDTAISYIEKGYNTDVEDYSLHDKGKKLLTQFKISNPDQRMGEMSGGQIKRVALAKVLAQEPDLLILDEPTNHLDIEMVEWIEKYLSSPGITVIMVTHDRYFLDKVCNNIIEIDRGKFYFYEGSYNYYLEKREERYDAFNSELLKVKNLLRTELEWMRRQPKARGTKSKSRIDNFYLLKEKSRVNLSTKEVELGRGGGYIGKKIFEAKNISKTFGDKKILHNWNYTFARNEKVGIVGDNGVGKTTFIKMLLGEIEPDSGSFDIGSTVRWGHYSQEGMINFDDQKKVIDAVREIAEEVRIDDKTRLSASQFLTRFLFNPQTQQDYISKLSGGERRRLYLATVLMKNPNFLILDEPTNDLDIVTLTILEDYLINFKGCVIIISHDRFFIDRIADHIFVFRGDGEVKDFPGNYSQYREAVKVEEETRKLTSLEKGNTNKNKEEIKKESRKKAGLTFKEKKEKENLESQIELLTNERVRIEELLSTGGLGREDLFEKSSRIQEIIETIDEMELRLLELMEKEEGWK